MSVRELVVLGTASQAPTRRRNHNGYLLRWDGEGILFDPGEGTQRQLTFAGVAPSTITRICLTHLHGDHCLGLPGVVQRLSLDQVTHPVELHYPAAGEEFVDRLLHASAFRATADVRRRPAEDGTVVALAAGRLIARGLAHPVPTLGWRLEEPDGRRMLPDRLAAAGIEGPAIGRLQREGSLEVGGRRVTLEAMSEPRRGQRMAFVMDTGWCDAALALAEGVDLLVCESTFLSSEADQAREYAHLTAAQAARLARDAGARRLVLTHFSRRYPDPQAFLQEAAPIFADVVVAEDLDRIPVPPRP